MKVWIVLHGWDYEGDSIVGVYSSFQKAYDKCVEDMGRDFSRFTIDKREDRLIAKRGSENYSIDPHDVE